MKMKFKSTTLSPRISVYKRFIGIEQSMSLKVVYMTSADGLYWTFNNDTKAFEELEEERVAENATIITVGGSTILAYMGTYYTYEILPNENPLVIEYGWVSTTTPPLTLNDVLKVKYANIGKYQLNKYYFVGTIDNMQKGSLSETTTQHLKGNIMPLTSTNIKFFNDYVKVAPDDLLVWHGRLYSVESVEVDHKHQPKDYSIYFATINSIL